MKNPNLYPDLDQNSAQEKLVLFVATLTSFMGPFTICTVNWAPPAIQSDLGIFIKLETGTNLLLIIGNLLLPGFGFALFSSTSMATAVVVLSISTDLCVL